MKEKKNAAVSSSLRGAGAFGDDLCFAAREAYKQLRVNLLFSLPETGEKCKVVGVTSSTRGEGKTTTSINLACSLADINRKVLLIDADMRLPGVCRMLQISGRPGLSNVLTSQADGKLPVRKSNLRDTLDILTGGDIPPNPSELLGAKAMETLINKLKEDYDFIIVDLPPVNVVSDALVVSPLCTGFVFVVRQGYTSRREVETAVKNLKHCRGKILGYVMNDAAGEESGYSKAYRSRYYNGDYKTSGAYAKAAARNAQAKKEEEEAAEIKGLDG